MLTDPGSCHAGHHRPEFATAPYTPPQHRRRGYGAAVTTACTHDALCGGAQHVVLFTDLANPTSNTLYQRLGYRPVSDRTITTFMH
jgi:predicted GNAT family acetyltransferase